MAVDRPKNLKIFSWEKFSKRAVGIGLDLGFTVQTVLSAPSSDVRRQKKLATSFRRDGFSHPVDRRKSGGT
jgi:hypothetical protein